MTSIDDNVSEITKEPSESNVPDWERIPFDVSCSRCGCDLRGLSEPVCPTCRLSIEWSEVAPIEHLTCLHCQYHLYGLSENRCPECGHSFTWEEVLLDYQCKRKPLFEYRWRQTPVRSFFGTWLRALRPKKFWSMLDLHDPPQTKPLLAMNLIAITLQMLILVTSIAIFFLLMEYVLPGVNGTRVTGRITGIGNLITGLFYLMTNSEIYSIIITTSVWVLTSFVSLLVFQQSMKRYKILTIQVFRVWAYSTPFYPITTLIIISLVSYILLIIGFMTDLRIGFVYIGWLIIPTALFCYLYVIRFIQVAYSDYLRMNHGLAVAISSQIMAILLALVILDLLGDRGYGIQIAIQLLDWIN